MGDLGWYDDVDAPRDGISQRIVASARSACRMSNLLPGLLILVGWLAFIGWTGAGSDGWQARVCAHLGGHAYSCGSINAQGVGIVANTGAAS